MSRTVENRPCLCPQCGAANDRVTDLFGDAAPSPGDFTICADCAAILRFSDDMTTRTATARDLNGLSEEFLTQILAMHIAANVANKVFNRKPPTGTKQ
jgi:hypothetical protein